MQITENFLTNQTMEEILTLLSYNKAENKE